jgi:hypothetical protein
MMKHAHEYENLTEAGLDRFVEQMKLKLDQNQEKKGDSWVTCPIKNLEQGFYRERFEYVDATNLMEKAKELMDVANFCMMLYNRYLDRWAELVAAGVIKSVGGEKLK